jgi:MFS family permease
VIFLGVAGWSIATASCGFARSYWQLFMARFAVGVGEAALTPAAYSLVGDLFPKRRLALALGILAAGTAAGSAIATGLGGLIIAWVTERGSLPGFAPWQVVFILVGLPGLIIAPLIFLVPERRRAQRVVVHADKPVNDGYFAWLRNHRAFVIPFFSAVSLAGIISYAYGAWLPAYLSRRFGLPIGDIGVTLGLVQGIPGIIGFIGGGWFVDRMVSAGIKDAHLRYLCSAMAVAGVFAVVGMAFSQSVTMLFIFLGLFHLTIPFTGPSIALIQMVSPRRFHSRTIALYTLAINMVGLMVGPSSVALFTEKVYGGPQHVGAGITTVLAISAPLAVLCFFVSMGPARRAIAENAAQGG